MALFASAVPAYAGGEITSVAAGPGTVWVTSSAGVDELDAHSGRVLREIVVGPAYPTAAAVAAGAVWIASVDQGSSPGTVLTRIDAATGSRRTFLHRQGWPDAVAVSSRTIWIAFGSRLARLDPAGRLLGVTSLGRRGWLAVDAAGAWFCCRAGRLLRIDLRGRIHESFAVPVVGPIWPAVGSLWVETPRGLDRIDERTGRVLARIPLGPVTDVAATRGAVYALEDGALARIDPATNRVVGQRVLPGTTEAVSAEPDGVWVTSVGRPGPPVRVYRLNPRTLATELTVSLY